MTYPSEQYKYECKLCYFLSCNKTNYNKHLETIKHKKQVILTERMLKLQHDKPSAEYLIENKYMCKCGKKYKHKQSLYNHRKTCNGLTEEVQKQLNDQVQKRVQKKVQEQLNEEVQKQVEEQVQKQVEEQVQKQVEEQVQKQVEEQVQVQEKVNEKLIEFYKEELKELRKENSELEKVTNITNNNQTFNLNCFLNDTCKDALSIQEFVKSLRLSLSHLDYSVDNGGEKGVINILKEGLMELDIDKRPIHCTDIKRETLYIKDTDNGWEKNSSNNKIKSAIGHVQHKYVHLIKEWEENNPLWLEDKELMDKFYKYADERYKDIDEKKVIKDIAKITTIDKKIESELE